MAKWLSQIVQVGLPINSFKTGRRDRRGLRASRSRSATRSSCASRSASSAASRRGTTRCTRSPPRSPPRWPPAARSCSSRARSPRVDAFVLAEVIDEVGPAGRRVQPGVRHRPGRSARRIAAHPDVDMVSFTGSTRAGKRVAAARRRDGQEGRPRARRQVGQRAARRPRRRRLRQGRQGRRRQGLPQLGPDLLGADPHARAARPPRTRPRRSPRPPSPRSRSATRSPRASTSARSPRPPSATGCRATSRRASTRAPTLVAGGLGAPDGLDTGFYVQPDRLLRRHAGHDDRPGGDLRPGAVDPAVRRRGGRRRASPTTSSTASPAACGRATRTTPSAVARRLRTGQVEVNGGAFNPNAPFGGYKQSGIGREYGAPRLRGVPGDQEPPALSCDRRSRFGPDPGRPCDRDPDRNAFGLRSWPPRRPSPPWRRTGRRAGAAGARGGRRRRRWRTTITPAQIQ